MPKNVPAAARGIGQSVPGPERQTIRAMTGALQLRDYPSEIVRLSCEKCGRAGQYRKQTLIERDGTDIRRPDLREEIAQCRRHGQMHDACMVRYVDLMPRRL